VFIENDVLLGDRVTIKSGVQLWDGITIEDDVFIGPNVTFTNDKFPRSRKWQDTVLKTNIQKGASIGANSTILPNITIGEGSMIGAGSVVTRSIPPYAIAYGNPARIHGYTDSGQTQNIESDESRYEVDQDFTLPGRAKVLKLKESKDARGSLLALDFNEFDLFEIRRVFFITNVPSNQLRGEHAHYVCSQFLFMLSGSVNVLLDDGKKRTEIRLAAHSGGLYIPPLIWSTEFQFSKNAVLAVLASHSFEEKDYIRDYQAFKSITNIQ
jgi:carbonic anhydrase/acetyltransferase-like protein (isoleucine patch superfamily)